jgi:hypothetical protein
VLVRVLLMSECSEETADLAGGQGDEGGRACWVVVIMQ